MPTMIKDRGNGWLARVILDGRQVDSRLFPPGRRHGPEWLAAKNWEVERKNEILKSRAAKRKILSGFALLLDWGERYLAHVERTMSRKTLVEKKTVMTAFFNYCREEGIASLADATKPALIQWLADVADERGPDRANRYRKNLLAAWHWGIDAVEGFPQDMPALERIKPFPVDSRERYVPPDEDVIRVLRVASGQDLVMLLALYYTGARRGEIFRLTWADVDLTAARIRLTDHKAGAGRKRVRWLEMHPDLVQALQWWRLNRPCNVPNVFMRIEHDSALGEPFTERSKLMPRLCARADVKPFGFHALRHKAASIAFAGGGLNAAQQLMGHYRATTTDIYIRSAGIYESQDAIIQALGSSDIGQAASELLEEAMPRGGSAHEAFCKPDPVNVRIQ